jgi:signal transduction histidine kinase
VLARVSDRSSGRMTPRLRLYIGGLGVLLVALLLLTSEALWTLRRGSDALETALERLPHDLHAEVPEPRAEELARFARGLRAMAARLVSARERERALERRLDHEQRLAGLGRVVAGVAHEIRNPLAAMKLGLDGMARRKLDARSTRDVSVCLEEIARLDKVVGSMLLVARKDPPQKEPLDLGDLVDERTRAAESLAAARDVTLSREGTAEVRAHRGHLTRVLDNLLRNAIEVSPEGGCVRIEIVADAAEVTIAVKDSGDGVPEARESELFEPFFTLRPEGTGLGLFLSRSLVEAHGGRLVYAREPTETRFVVTLPRGEPHA